MQMEVFILGTSGMMPLVNRHLCSALLRLDGRMFLFDCGEGTQVALRKAELSWKKIERIFISHMHSDHLTGLPGLLMLSSQVEREEPLHIYGPALLEEYINENRRILDMYINYEIIFHSVEGRDIIYEDDEIELRAFRLDHTKPCWAYSVKEKDRPGVFNVERAKSLGIPQGPLWGRLQHGEEVEIERDGKKVKIYPCDVLGEARDGFKFCYVTDTKYFPEIANFAFRSDILIVEAMFTEELIEDAASKKHMTSLQAASVIKDSDAKRAYLIHYSPRYSNYELKKILQEVRDFNKESAERIFLSRDGMRISLKHED